MPKPKLANKKQNNVTARSIARKLSQTKLDLSGYRAMYQHDDVRRVQLTKFWIDEETKEIVFQ